MKIKVPEGMLKAALKPFPDNQWAIREESRMRLHLEAALRWLSENPIVPTSKDLEKIAHNGRFTGEPSASSWCIEWQRRMFLVEPEVPEEIKDLLHPTKWQDAAGQSGPTLINPELANEHIIEAFRRGRETKLR